jgi:glyoxylate/hydroxypyruvate/2-ketogluconate reductase
MTRVAVTRDIPPQALAALRAHFEVLDNPGDLIRSRPELLAWLQGCDGVLLAGGERIDDELLQACPTLRAVCNMAVGYNNIDVPACTARGVWVTNTPDVLTETTADFGFALMMAAARRITEGERHVREGLWTRWHYDLLTGAEVHGRTLAILGMGRIGQGIARRGALGFGMRVLYHNRSRLSPELEADCRATWVDKATLLREADHLVIVLPYSIETHHAVGAPELACMKAGATLTNIARGGVVDDVALAQALARGSLAAAGLDVFEGEPTVHPDLLALRNVVLTPHIASASRTTRLAMGMLAAENLIAALGAGPHAGCPPTPVNPEVAAS